MRRNRWRVSKHQLPLVYEETARAISDVVVQRVLATDLRAAMEVNSRLAIFVAEHLAGYRRWVQRRLLRAIAQSVEWRVIETLVELAGTFGAQCPHGFSLEIRLTQQDIADFVGASRQVVSSILSDLRRRGLLDYTRDMICINDSALWLLAPGRRIALQSQCHPSDRQAGAPPSSVVDEY